MSESGQSPKHPESLGRLAEQIREMKNALADRDDVVVELREASRMRLELLAQELSTVFEETPKDSEQFDFTISSGLQPRLWIDATAHVAMGRDRRVYRFVRDTRLGRVVLAETAEMKDVADKVTRYIAERMIERERMMNGDVHPAALAVETQAAPSSTGDRWAWFLWALTFIVIGAAAGVTAVLAWLWDKLPPAVMP
ncbi:hypothetical protein [Mesorhizobium australicum]|uniref:Uncharacterized protein n=1 Tax=Mesorhizobium australicum TaxID=536018 RepID=A0A1X7PKJ3_9HYPH|nr:hypothetical protein [Mesorhizobium australicum]SMH51267.1 hypothetical protein SAMN02982922_4373 [Mesorhizobium australicum]